MSSTRVRKMILGAAAAAVVATLVSGCGSNTQNQSPGGTHPSPSSSHTKAPKGGGAAF